MSDNSGYQTLTVPSVQTNEEGWEATTLPYLHPGS
jgi:hypothetical protein